MIVNLLLSGDVKTALITLLMWLPIILFSLSFHEAAHAFISYKLGDPTAKNLGRCSLNPAKHLDPLGFCAMLLIGFGWAKPVPIYPRNFRDPRKGMAISSLAGPVSNFLLAVVFTLLCGTVNFIASLLNPGELAYTVLFYTYRFFYFGIYLNVALAIFNFIPIPPLDGSRIVSLILPPKYYFSIMKYERYIGIGFMVLVIFLSRFLNVSLIDWIVDPITNGLLWLSGSGSIYFGIFGWML